MMTTPIDALYDRAIISPGGTAFIHRDVVHTYYDLVIASERLARGLLSRGVHPGDRIVLHMSNRPEMVFAFYACLRIGAIACPMNLRYEAAEIREMFQRLRPSIYLGEESLYSAVEGIEPQVLAPAKRFVIGSSQTCKGAMPWSALQAGSVFGRLPTPPSHENAPALLLMTSGTTGRPKFVAHTPASLAAIAELSTCSLLDEGHILISAAPLVHGSGLFTLLGCINFGVTVVLVERFDPDVVLDQIEMHGCAGTGGLPFMYHALLKHQRLRPREISSLRYCFCVGDVCPVQLHADFEQTFGKPLRSVWGSTEAAGPLTYTLGPEPVYRIGSGAQVRLADEDGRTVPRGEVGEFLVRGPEIAAGYWIGPGRVENLAPDGWFHSGDLMRQDEGDELWFVGRKKDQIISGGSVVSPVDVERVLLSHPLVRDAAVFGLPDPVLGQRVAAVVALQGNADDATRDKILDAARKQLAYYKVPEVLVVVDAVPRNALGKIDRRALAASANSGTNA
jgi:long-chain acyl-CoA synthetase